ncbi:hypothetical protein [Rickettsiella endosymbiont of Miltochrista miniata]|uniref:hypothetical protein n=1 Tax=Rickettsiella endosymbiont of Miltochrista miniata TaxID=3066239 RepID=UPI00313E9080
MQEESVWKFIRHFGSITKAANIIGISRATIYNYLEGRPIPLDIALRIEAKSRKRIIYKELISWKVKYNLELETFPGSLTEIPLTKIIMPVIVPRFSDHKYLSKEKQRAICVDENYQLIYGLKAIEITKKQGKKSIVAWRISHADLIQRKFEIFHLTNTFDLLERTAIGISLEKFIGNRKGQRTDLKKTMENSPHFYLERGIRTRDFVTELLDLNSSYIYIQLKKIILHGSDEIIEKVRNKKISVSAAASQVVCL